MDITNRRYVLSAAFLFSSLMVIMVLLCLLSQEDLNVHVNDINSYMKGNSGDISFHIDYCQYTNVGAYETKGWCIKKGLVYEYYNYGNDATRSSVYNNMHIGLTDGKSVYIIPTKLELRDDVNKYINDGIDYRFCGFRSSIPQGQIDNIENKDLVLIWENPDGMQELYYLK